MRLNPLPLITLFVMVVLTAAASASSPFAHVDRSEATIQWHPLVQRGAWALTVSGPDGFYHRERFTKGSAPSFSIFSAKGATIPEGAYAWELVFEPSVSEAEHEAMAARRQSEMDDLVSGTGAAQSKSPLYTSGYFSVQNGAFATQAEESTSSIGPATVSSSSLEGVSSNVLLTSADGVIRNSLCVGSGCPTSPTFSDSTILMMENNTRIKFADTSNSPFPNNDWEIEANSSSSGGANYLGFNDCGTADNDGGCTTDLVFAVESGARQNALYVEGDGDVGIGTNNPAVDLHIVTGGTPALRLDQNGSLGFAPQAWDVAGNETNFFVRDVTNSSKLPFRIRPNAPTSSIDINGSGNVGVGTSSPDAKLDVEGSGTTEIRITRTTGDVWRLVNFSSGEFAISLDGSGGRELEVDGSGNVTITGDYFSTTCTAGNPCAPDYVFEADYDLLPLDELEVFIEKEKHLPNIPAADELVGPINLSKMQMKLLEKIEELTLYTLEQQKSIEILKAQNEELMRRLPPVQGTKE